MYAILVLDHFRDIGDDGIEIDMKKILLLSMAQQPPAGQALLIIEASRSHMKTFKVVNI
jgi:hypothetical protein